MKINWRQNADEIFDWSKAAINRFAREHRGEKICSLFFDTDPEYGYVLIAFDTLENSLRSARSSERLARERRAQNLTGKLTWEWAKYQLSTPVLEVFNSDSGGFAYPEYDTLEFPAWQKLAKSGDYPRGEEHDNDYLEGNVRIVLWQVTERLIENRCFRSLTRASPFMIGYGIHDQESVILRILNWPKA
jgi:hypothetical protein